MADNNRLKHETQLLREELRIKDVRLAKIDPRRRPYYPPTERMAILELKAARGWSLAQTARTFLVEPETIAAWGKRVDEDGSSALVQLRQPVNRFPDFVRYIVQRLKVLVHPSARSRSLRCSPGLACTSAPPPSEECSRPSCHHSSQPRLLLWP